MDKSQEQILGNSLGFILHTQSPPIDSTGNDLGISPRLLSPTQGEKNARTCPERRLELALKKLCNREGRIKQYVKAFLRVENT